MTQYNFTKPNFDGDFDSLYWAMPADVRVLYVSHQVVGDAMTIDFGQALTSQQESDLQAAIDAHPIINGQLRIYDYAKYDALHKHYHNINYVIDVQKLHPKRIFLFGAVVQVIWYAEPALITPVIQVDILYNYDTLGFATDRTVTRSWYRKNGQLHPHTKVTTKDYTINPQDQLDEAILRRKNNVRQTNLALIGVVPGLTQADPLVTDRTAEEVRDDGVSFYNNHTNDLTTYIETGSQNLENAVRDDITLSPWGTPVTGWFNANAQSLGITGVNDVRDFIIYNLSNGQRNKNGDI